QCRYSSHVWRVFCLLCTGTGDHENFPTEIKVVCEKDAVKITWRIHPDYVPYAARFFLGNCMASQLKVLPSGEGEAHFNADFTQCKFRKLVMYQKYQTEAPSSHLFLTLVVTVGWSSTWRFSTVGFHDLYKNTNVSPDALLTHCSLTELLTGIAKTNIIPLGSFMPIWAAVEQKSHQPLMLLMEECVAATSPELKPGKQLYPIVGNQGCLFESVNGNSVFLPRYHSSALILYLQSFKFGLGKEVYIHCKLVAWDPEVLNENKKTCHYVKEEDSWQLLDDPLQSSLCSCCSSSCRTRSKRGVEWGIVSMPPWIIARLCSFQS
uniref:Zona pellucida glycoprotein 3f, tandem duplicate 2 n=1 Tax=Salarias fasciatus TaxID=181472 RepID=A0A672HS71_SALFA